MVRPPGFEPGIAGLEGFHPKDCVLTRLDHGRKRLNHNLHIQKIRRKIINTLVKLENKGLSDVKYIGLRLSLLAEHVDLDNLEQVASYIAAMRAHYQSRCRTFLLKLLMQFETMTSMGILFR